MNTSRTVLDHILTIWNTSPEKRGVIHRKIRFKRNWLMRPEQVIESLLHDFPIDEIEAQVSAFLETMVALFEHDIIPDERQIFLANCCLWLIGIDNGIRISKNLILGIVRSFPSIIFYEPVGKLVHKFLFQSELLESLLKGLQQSSSKFICLSCLEAIRLYHGLAKVDYDKNRLGITILSVENRLDQLIQSVDVDIQKSAQDAKVRLKSYKV